LFCILYGDIVAIM